MTLPNSQWKDPIITHIINYVECKNTTTSTTTTFNDGDDK